MLNETSIRRAIMVRSAAKHGRTAGAVKVIGWNAALVVALAVLVSGCAVGNRYAYHTVIVDPNLPGGDSRISVATNDQREYVISGNKDPRFIGLQRGGYGNPFDVKTANDRPLADNMTMLIVAALQRRGFQAVPIFIGPNTAEAQVKQKLLETGIDRALLLTLREWKSDTMMNVGFVYDVTLVVMNREGQIVAKKDLQGRDNLGGSFWSPTGHAKDAVPQAVKAKLEQLLGDPSIASALR